MSYTKNILSVVLISFLFMSFTSSFATWEFLGQRKVNYGLDRDEIRVTAKEGVFTKIKLQVKKAPVEFNKVIVHYRNGTSESIQLRQHIPAGGETRVIDLNGKKRIITKVVFYYNSKVKARKKGVVKLYGRH